MTTITDLISRRRDLFCATDELYEQAGDAAADSAEYIAMLEEITVVEHRIVATTATSMADFEAKERFMAETDFVGNTGDFERLIEAILQRDADNIAA